MLFYQNIIDINSTQKKQAYSYWFYLQNANQFYFFIAEVTFSSSVEYDTEPGMIEVGSKQFMIAVKNDQTNFLKKPMFNLTFERRHYQRFTNGTYIKEKIPMQLEPCTLEHFSEIPSKQINWTKVFIEQNVQDYLCLNLFFDIGLQQRKDEVFKIGGAFENEHFYHIKFSMVQCVNQTQWYSHQKWRPVCETPENIKNSIKQDTRINILVTNMQLNPERTTDPAQSFLNSLIFSFQPEKVII